MKRLLCCSVCGVLAVTLGGCANSNSSGPTSRPAEVPVTSTNADMPIAPRVTEEPPDLVRANTRFLRGCALLGLGDLDAARTEFRMLLDADEGDDRARTALDAIDHGLSPTDVATSLRCPGR